MGLFYREFFAKYWKEIAVLAIIYFAFLFAFETYVVESPLENADFALSSSFSLIAVFLPIPLGFLGAILANRKSKELKYAIFVPAVAMMIATLAIICINFYISANQANNTVAEQLFYDLEYDTYTDMNYAQYVNYVTVNLYPELSMLFFSNFGAAIVGAMIFRKMRCLVKGSCDAKS